MRSARLALLVAFMLVAQPGIAHANGADFSTRNGRPGDEVRVEGSDLLTCCPSGTPSDPVVVRMIVGQQRLVLLETAADSAGRIEDRSLSQTLSREHTTSKHVTRPPVPLALSVCPKASFECCRRVLL
jgi:hypothetical protein